MRKILLLMGFAVIISTSMFAQVAKQNMLGRKPATHQTKALTGSVSTTTVNYAAGATFDIVINYTHVSPDLEYVDGISLDFPAGVTVNSGTDFELACNGETGDGALISWGDMAGGSMYGDLSADASFSVNVTVDPGFTGNLDVAFNVVGDGYGEAPNSITGSITLTEAAASDLGVTGVTPLFVMEGNDAYPSVMVTNYGTTTIDDFDVEVVINDGTTDVYTSTLNVTGAELAFGNDDEFVMTDLWSPANGNYTITATVILTGDGNAANDELVSNCGVDDFVTAYAINGEAETFESVVLPIGLTTEISSFDAANFPMAMEFAIGHYYVIRNSPAELYTIDVTDGSTQMVATITGMTGTPTSLAYNWDNSTMYVMILDGEDIPHLGTLNLTTGVATEIGAGTGLVIAMDFANDGTLYATTLEDLLVTVDIATGAITTVGNLGIDINYGQDISYDKKSGILYGIVYGDQIGLASFDLATGAATVIATYTEQYACFAIPYLVGPQLVSVTPVNGSDDNAIDATVSVTFDVNITEVDFDGIAISPDPGNVTASIVDNVLTIAHDAFEYNTEYTVIVPAGAVSDGIDNLDYDVEWSFATMLDPTACNDPSDIVVSDIEIFEATVSWTENGIATQWLVVYGEAGFDPETEGTQVTVDVTATTTLTELDADTDYDVYVQAICGVETSGWAGPVEFTTLYDCSTVTTITQGFEEGVPPICWETYETGAGTNVWTVSTTIYNTGAASAVANYQNSGADNVQWLVSNEVVVPDNHKLVFWTRDQFTTAYTSTLAVKISTDAGVSYTNLLTIDETMVTNTAFAMFEIPMTGYFGQSAKIAFVMTDDDGDNWFVDDVSFEVISNVENNQNTSVSVYPNPSNGLVNIAVTENSVVSVIDIAGRTVAAYNVNANEEVTFTQAAGMYIVKVEANGNVSTHKLVIE